MEAPAPPMLCSSMGATSSLLEKMTALTENQRNPKIKNLMQDIKSLRDDFLDKFSGRLWADKSKQVKVWMKQAREMIYDIEDWIDLRQEGASEESDEKQIEKFRRQVKVVRKLCEAYELPSQVPASDPEPVYGGSSGESAGAGCGLPGKMTAMVGIDGAKSKLLNHLKNKQEELMVVSILGAGGHGKTALAKEICGDTHIKEQFECQAFVSVCRTTSTRTTLIDILRQVKSEEDALQYRSSNEIMKELWGFLRTKRYFICTDDIRNIEVSEIIICALPDNNLGSRILVTTRMEDIAISCSRRPNDVVYEMVALDKCDSDRLFLNTVYDPEKKWADSFEEYSNKVFEVCGGVPLATIIAAGLLGREVPVRSEVLFKTILSGFQFHSTSEAMRNLLDISYGDLPLPMKSCFLYLSAFPGNYYIIKKDRLIRRWVAEGLLPENHVKSPWETGESYFDELISRRLIQPVFDDGQIIGCTVHGVVFDYIESLSSEANFITAGAELKSGLVPYGRVRRVSLAYGVEDSEGDSLISNKYCLFQQKCLVAEAVHLHLSRVRSLAFSGDAGRIPDLSAFKHVRVLDLEDASGLENKQLRSIGSLYLLRYLALGKTDVIKLPEEILALELLTTLDLRRTRIRNLQGFRDKNLISLLSDQWILVGGMGRMQKLEELSKVLVGPDGSPAEYMAGLVHELGRLRMLGVRFSYLHGQNETDRQGVKHFLEEVGKSNRLQSLLLDNYPDTMLDLLANNSWANNSLRKFELRVRGRLPQVPQEMASVMSLTHLHISVETIKAQAVRTLGSLPKLILLKLYFYTSPQGLVVTKEDGFLCLKVLWFNCQYGGGMGLQFREGAMPELRRLQLDLDAGATMLYHDGFDFGIKHLTRLAQVHVTIDWVNTRLTPPQVQDEEARIREWVSRYPSRPVLELNRRKQCPVARAAEGLVIEIHSREQWFKQLDPKKLVVVHFSASWCPASRKMVPVFSGLAKKFPNVIFLKADVEDDEMGAIARQFHVEGVPTFLFMKGSHDVDRVIGSDKEKLEEKLQQQLA